MARREPECNGTKSIPARDLAPDLSEQIVRVSLAAYRAMGLRDYGRIDLRLHPERGPLILESTLTLIYRPVRALPGRGEERNDL